MQVASCVLFSLTVYLLLFNSLQAQTQQNQETYTLLFMHLDRSLSEPLKSYSLLSSEEHIWSEQR